MAIHFIQSLKKTIKNYIAKKQVVLFEDFIKSIKIVLIYSQIFIKADNDLSTQLIKFCGITSEKFLLLIF